ncbi:uncharacterized protein LOC126554189, partial [Aphis gossypii]|uniref:uncharacterized protein LOC126554189 n=1 Tax=Aphis gossypii TaxID=80765 RepID=UPI002158F368
YLATGLAFRQLALTFRISKSGVAQIVIDVCKAIWCTLKDKHMPTPTVDHFKIIADEFYEKWNFHNCASSIDGKHIRLKCPKNSGIVDAKYRFIMINVGGYGKDNDSGILCNTNFHQRLENGTLKLPIERKLNNSDILAPYVFVGDEAFPLRNYLMRPFPRKQAQETKKSYYNYRLSRARMTVECAFGIAFSKFRILLKAIETKVENADHIVKAVCILHNVIIDIEKDELRNQEIINTFHESNTNSNNNQLMGINPRHRSNNRASRTAIQIRNNFVQYFQENKI